MKNFRTEIRRHRGEGGCYAQVNLFLALVRYFGLKSLYNMYVFFNILLVLNISVVHFSLLIFIIWSQRELQIERCIVCMYVLRTLILRGWMKSLLDRLIAHEQTWQSDIVLFIFQSGRFQVSSNLLRARTVRRPGMVAGEKSVGCRLHV